MNKLKRAIHQVKYGFSDKETWNLDLSFVKWLNGRLKRYKTLASQHINLEFHKIKYHRHNYTLLELIDKMIEISDMLLEYELTYHNYPEEYDTLLEMFNLTLPYLWW